MSMCTSWNPHCATYLQLFPFQPCVCQVTLRPELHFYFFSIYVVSVGAQAIKNICKECNMHLQPMLGTMLNTYESLLGSLTVRHSYDCTTSCFWFKPVFLGLQGPGKVHFSRSDRLYHLYIPLTGDSPNFEKSPCTFDPKYCNYFVFKGLGDIP